jgi:hypothetical protein
MTEMLQSLPIAYLPRQLSLRWMLKCSSLLARPRGYDGHGQKSP